MKCCPTAVFYVWASFGRLVWVIGCLRLMLGREQMETLKSTAWIQSVSLHEISPGETISIFFFMQLAKVCLWTSPVSPEGLWWLLAVLQILSMQLCSSEISGRLKGHPLFSLISVHVCAQELFCMIILTRNKCLGDARCADVLHSEA